ncbi:hypothetical protein [Blastococcus sp. SYSU D00820]
MSSPDPNYPPQGAPYGQPGPGPQGYGPGPQGYGAPVPGYSGAPAGYGGTGGQRPGMATAAAIVAIVWGGLGILLGLLALSLAFLIGALYGLIILLSVAMSAALLVGGIFVLQGKSPKLLLLLCYIAIAVNLLSLIISLAQSGGSVFSGLLGFVIPGVIIGLLMQAPVKQYYAARGQSY